MTSELVLGIAYGVFGTLMFIGAFVAWVAVSGGKRIDEELEETSR